MSTSKFASFLAPFRARPIALAGLIILVVIVIMAVASPWIAPYDPEAIDPAIRLSPPSLAHPFGTDQSGRDTFSRVVYGARMALLVGVSVVLFALATGVPIGVISALYPRLGQVMMRLIDTLMAFPALLLALGLIVILGASMANSILAVGLGFLTTTTRIVYGLTLRLRAETYVEAARSMGAGTWWLVSRHILPNLVSPLLVQASFIFAFSQLAAASLDYLGLGAPLGIPSWGNMLAESRRFIELAPWLLYFPGLMIALTALALNLVGDALRDRLDPRFRHVMGD